MRLKEATALFDQGLYDGAYYLAGYAVECALKACIAKKTRRYEFPDKKTVNSSYSHNLKELIGVAGLEESRLESAHADPGFEGKWDTVLAWSEQSRYRRQDKESAQRLLDAMSDKPHGVMKWIRLHW